MADRMNTVEGQLLTDLLAESDITDVFATDIERGFRDRIEDYRENELPAICFECVECNDIEPVIDGKTSNEERLTFVLVVVVDHGIIKTARQYIKTYISLVRDFLRSDSWTYVQNTEIGRGAIEEIPIHNSFRAVGLVEFTVDVETD